MNENKVRSAVEIAYAQVNSMFDDEYFAKTVPSNGSSFAEFIAFSIGQSRKEMKELLIRTLRELAD